MTQVTEAGVSMDYLYSFTNNDVSENGEERKDCGEGSLAVDDKKRNIVDLQSVGKVSHTRPSSIGMSDNDDFVSTVDQFLFRLRRLIPGS